jgi:hypothetical protein
VSQSKKFEAFKNDATPGVQASISLKRYTKENEVTGTAQSKKSNTKETILKGLHSTAKTILSKMADRLIILPILTNYLTEILKDLNVVGK